MMQIDYPPVKSKTHVAIIAGKACDLYHNHQMVKWHYRWRLIQKDEIGGTYVEDKYTTAFFEIIPKSEVENYLGKLFRNSGNR